MNTILILALIQALTQEVQLLEQQLAQLQAETTAVTSTYVAPALPISVSSTPVVEPTIQTTNTTMPVERGAVSAPQTISVTFATSIESEGLVTITNTLGETVRLKSLDVDGTLAGYSYTPGLVYQQSFKDVTGKTFDTFTCTGLGSLGLANLGSSGMIDPCMRRDAQLPKNELQPGETMTLRYTGNPTGVTYQPGSITDLAGNEVQF